MSIAELEIGRIAQAFDSNGFVVIADLLAADDCERLAANVAEIREMGAG